MKHFHYTIQLAFLGAGILFYALTTTSASAQTVIDMPPPPMSAVKLPTMDIEHVTKPSDIVTWHERVAAANLAGPQRSYLGTVALTRYRKARGRSYHRYYNVPRYNGNHGNYGYQNNYPFNVSFLHGVPTHYGGYDYPWVGFGTHIGFYGTW